jgi:hypothetical protein
MPLLYTPYGYLSRECCLNATAYIFPVLRQNIRTCSHRICTWIFEHNFDEGKGAGVQWTPLQSRSTDRDDSWDSKKRKHTVVWWAFST